MPLYLCVSCAHEFEASEYEKVSCGWCKSENIVMLEKETPLEKTIKNINNIMKKIKF